MIYFFTLLGLVFGSFFTVLTERLPNEKSIKGRSVCLGCGYQLRWYDLVPVFSFLYLKGRCRYCKQAISSRYFLIEICTAIAFLSAYYIASFNGFVDYYTLLFLLLSFSLAILTFIIDLRFYLILDIFNILFFVLFFLLQLAYDIKIGNDVMSSLVLSGLLGGVFMGGMFYLLYRMTKGEGLGFGDVKIAPVIGMAFGLTHTIYLLLIASVLGSLVGLALMMVKKIKRKTPLPFGVFLAIGVVLTALVKFGIINVL